MKLPLIVALVAAVIATSGVLADPARAQPTPFTITKYSDVRPGTVIGVGLPPERGTVKRDDAASCTANFAFKDAQRHNYLGTAGHCYMGRGPFNRTWRYRGAPPAKLCREGRDDPTKLFVCREAGPPVYDVAGREIGRMLYALWDIRSFDNATFQRDFGIIRLHDNVVVNPQMAHFGGPKGLNEDITSTPTVLHHYGWGAVGFWYRPLCPSAPCFIQNHGVHGRTGIAPHLKDPGMFTFEGFISGGDSGSPVISSDGRALGFITALLVQAVGGDPNEGIVFANRLRPRLEEAEDALGIDLELQTAPVCNEASC